MPAEGTKFGRYVLLRQLAVGGMAEIFLAKQQGPGRFERSVIIKRILPHLAKDPKFVGMFLDEAALAAQLSHPHIAQLFDFGQEEGHYFLALELVRGPDLASVIDACRRLGQPPPVELSVRMAAQILEALQYAHHAADEEGQPLRIVHRDVSPQNVLVSHAGGVKLIDFGIAKATSAIQKTEAGMVKGKFTYMAPEQLRGEPLDGRCDQFAAGLVLYELLTLKTGLAGEGTGAIAAALEARIVPIQQVRPDLPPALVEAIGRSLRPRREERFDSCSAMAQALDSVLASAGLVVQDGQIGEYLDRLEGQIGMPLSPVGKGSSSGEKVSSPAAAAAPGSGPHDTAISGTPVKLVPAVTAPEPSAAEVDLVPSPQGRGPGRWVALAALAAVAAGGAYAWHLARRRALLAQVVAEPAPAPPLPAVPVVKAAAAARSTAKAAPAPAKREAETKEALAAAPERRVRPERDGPRKAFRRRHVERRRT